MAGKSKGQRRTDAARAALAAKGQAVAALEQPGVGEEQQQEQEGGAARLGGEGAGSPAAASDELDVEEGGSPTPSPQLTAAATARQAAEAQG